MIERDRYIKLREKYGHVAVWAPPADRIKENIWDLGVFDDEEKLLEILNPAYVFVGLNGAEHVAAESAPKQAQPWRGFHSSDIRRCQDYKIRYALAGTRFWGAYMTDVIKEYSKTDSSSVRRYLTTHPEVVEHNIAMFREELYLLGADPLVITFGVMAYGILRAHMPEDFRLIRVTHYSHFIGACEYRKKLLAQLADA
ncbi:MAG: hypothetical protein J5855_10660 [Mailhella sp.]|nr:hypothetical protein [Mailhella sp.]